MIGFDPFCWGGKPAWSRSVAFWLPVPGSADVVVRLGSDSFHEQRHAGRANDPEHDHDHRVGGHQSPEPVEHPGHLPRQVYATICSRAGTIGRITEDRYQRLPFDLGEYRDRELRVRAEMQRRGIDVLYVMSPANLNYLTGFESIWYPPRAPLGAIVRAHDPGIVFVDYERHRNHALNAAHWDETVFVDYASALDTVFSVFTDRGWTQGSVGIEWHTVAPSGPLVSALAAGLAERGAEIVDGDWVVDRVRLVKSPAEVACVRRASEIADGAFERLPEIVRPGMTEIEIAARLDLAMAELGGEHAGVRTMVSAGPLVWCQTHFAPTRRPVEVGDIMYIDACGVYNRYHVDVCRTYAIGRDNPQAREMLEHTARSVEKVQEAVRPGDPLEVAQRIAEEHVFARFPPEQVWWVGGYALGIAFPPSWVGHTYIANDAYEKFTWEPGYVTNYENIVFDSEAGITASYMETLMMTDTGIEILSRLPRTLTLL